MVIPRRPHFLLAALPIAFGGLIFLTLQLSRDRQALRRLERLDPPFPVLAEPKEDPARPAGAWVRLALGDRELFDQAATFCREHREDQGLPLPNCDNVLAADRLLPILPVDSGFPIHRHHRDSADAR